VSANNTNSDVFNHDAEYPQHCCQWHPNRDRNQRSGEL